MKDTGSFGRSKRARQKAARRLSFWSRPVVRHVLVARVTKRLRGVRPDLIKEYPLVMRCRAVNELTHMGLLNSKLWVDAYMP